MRPMRRIDRQVADEAGIRAILDRCQICRLALWDEEGPYIVPMSYGYRMDEGGLKLYFHCAGEGRKLDALRRDPVPPSRWMRTMRWLARKAPAAIPVPTGA